MSFSSVSFMLLAIFQGRDANILFKDVRKMTLTGKTEIYGYHGDCFAAVAEQSFSFFRFLLENKVSQSLAGFFLEFIGKIGSGKEEIVGKLLHVERLGHMMTDVVPYILDKF